MKLSFTISIVLCLNLVSYSPVHCRLCLIGIDSPGLKTKLESLDIDLHEAFKLKSETCKSEDDVCFSVITKIPDMPDWIQELSYYTCISSQDASVFPVKPCACMHYRAHNLLK